MTNRELRRALLQTLGISPQALFQQCQRLKKQIPMTTEEAVYVIAQRNKIVLDKYLDKGTIERVRVLYQQVFPATQQNESRKSERVKTVIAKPRIIKIGKDLTFNDPILPQRKIDEANEMANVYPIIYVLENSIRQFIDRIMAAKYGDNWWETQAPKPLREDVSIRMADDKKHSWHQRRGARPIDYLDLKDLPRLVGKVEKIVVPNIIPSLEWFRQLIEEVYKSRCVVCHMNPLDKNNIKAVEVRFNHWQKQITEKKDLILPQST